MRCLIILNSAVLSFCKHNHDKGRITVSRFVVCDQTLLNLLEGLISEKTPKRLFSSRSASHFAIHFYVTLIPYF